MARIETDYSSPVGELVVVEEDGWLTELRWGRARHPSGSDLLDEARAQLDAYFAGRLRLFNLPMAPRASAFQHGYNEALAAIRFGETRTYGQLAKALEVTPQAIGQACGANPIPIILPCHRVLATGGLGGYSGAGGIETKVALLRLEGAGGLLI